MECSQLYAEEYRSKHLPQQQKVCFHDCNHLRAATLLRSQLTWTRCRCLQKKIKLLSLDPGSQRWIFVSLLKEGHNHLIVRFAYLRHMNSKELVFFSFLYIKLLSLVQKSLSTSDLRLPTTKLICSNSHFRAAAAAALSALMMLLRCSFASASFTSRNPLSLSVDHLNSKIYMISLAADSQKLFSSPQRAHVTFFVKRDKLELAFWLLCSGHAVIQVLPDGVVGSCNCCRHSFAA